MGCDGVWDVSWDAVFGQGWFWAAAGLYWIRAALVVFGAPRRLVSAALSEPGAADFARNVVRYRLGAGSPVPIGLIPLRWPAVGALSAYLAIDAVFGNMLSLALLTGVAPIMAATLALEPRLLSALQQPAASMASSAASGASDAPPTFPEALDQIWKARFAATLVAAFGTAIAAAATAPPSS